MTEAAFTKQAASIVNYIYVILAFGVALGAWQAKTAFTLDNHETRIETQRLDIKTIDSEIRTLQRSAAANDEKLANILKIVDRIDKKLNP